MNIRRKYKVNLSDWRHHHNPFEAVHIYISWDFLSLLLSPSVSVSFSPPYSKVSLMLFVVPYCSLYRTKNGKQRWPRKLVSVLESVLSHCLIPDFFSEPSNLYILLMLQFSFFFFLFTLQTTASLPIIWAVVELNSPKQILKWNFQCSHFADSE